MSKKKPGLQITQESLRATFAILRSQLRLAEPTLRLRAIHEFGRSIGQLYIEEVDRRAQASGRNYEEENAIVEQEAKTWIAKPTEIP